MSYRIGTTVKALYPGERKNLARMVEVWLKYDSRTVDTMYSHFAHSRPILLIYIRMGTTTFQIHRLTYNRFCCTTTRTFNLCSILLLVASTIPFHSNHGVECHQKRTKGPQIQRRAMAPPPSHVHGKKNDKLDNWIAVMRDDCL
jgi:hypothetical protein